MMFSESHNDRYRRPRGRRSPQGLRQRRRDQIGDNSAEIGDCAAGIVDIAANVIPMLNSVLNGDWSNSVPGRKIPEGSLRDSLNNVKHM